MPIRNLSSEQLDFEIVAMVQKHNVSYLDAVMMFCERNKLEPEDVAPLLGEKIKTHLHTDGQALHLLPRENALF